MATASQPPASLAGRVHSALGLAFPRPVAVIWFIRFPQQTPTGKADPAEWWDHWLQRREVLERLLPLCANSTRSERLRYA
jgi:hypothetical protein